MNVKFLVGGSLIIDGFKSPWNNRELWSTWNCDINLVKKHVKPNPNKEQTGGIIEREMPLDASNIMIYNPISKKADKVGFKFLENGKKVRIYKSNKEVIDI